MLGFGSAKGKAVALTVEEQIVDEIDAEFASWREDQKDAFAQVLCRLLPKIAAEGGGLAGLPLDRVAAVFKRAFWKFIPRAMLDKSAALDRLGKAFMTRGGRMRAFCARTAATIPELAAAASDNAAPVGPTLAPGSGRG